MVINPKRRISVYTGYKGPCDLISANRIDRYDTNDIYMYKTMFSFKSSICIGLLYLSLYDQYCGNVFLF